MKGNYQYKFLFISIYDIASVEKWLSDMAANGLFLVSFGSCLMKFKVAPPKNMLYRLEPMSTPDDLPPKKQREMYAEFGWEFVTRIQNYFFVFSNEEASPVELHTDPVVLGNAFERIFRSQKWNMICSICLFAMIMYSVFQKYLDPAFSTPLWQWPNFRELLFVPFCLFGLYQILKEYRLVSTAKQQLESGVFLTADEGFQKKAQRNKQIFFCQLGIFLIMVLLLLWK